MKYFLIAGEVTLAIGFGLACIALIVTRRAAATHAAQPESNSIPLPEFRPDGRGHRDARSSHP